MTLDMYRTKQQTRSNSNPKPHSTSTFLGVREREWQRRTRRLLWQPAMKIVLSDGAWRLCLGYRNIIHRRCVCAGNMTNTGRGMPRWIWGGDACCAASSLGRSHGRYKDFIAVTCMRVTWSPCGFIDVVFMADCARSLSCACRQPSVQEDDLDGGGHWCVRWSWVTRLNGVVCSQKATTCTLATMAEVSYFIPSSRLTVGVSYLGK
jgi:hypothetical protein